MADKIVYIDNLPKSKPSADAELLALVEGVKSIIGTSGICPCSQHC